MSDTQMANASMSWHRPAAMTETRADSADVLRHRRTLRLVALLLGGYGLAAFIAVTLWIGGAFWSGLLTFWIGGAAFTLALAVLAWLVKRFSPQNRP